MSNCSPCLGLQRDQFSSGLWLQFCMRFTPLGTCTTYPAHPWFYHSNTLDTWRSVQSMKFLFMSFSLKFYSNRLLSQYPHSQIPVLKHPHLLLCLNVTDRVSEPCKWGGGKCDSVTYLHALTLLNRKLEDRCFWSEFNIFLISSECNFYTARSQAIELCRSHQG
jgi:hypothetical protein